MNFEKVFEMLTYVTYDIDSTVKVFFYQNELKMIGGSYKLRIASKIEAHLVFLKPVLQTNKLGKSFC